MVVKMLMAGASAVALTLAAGCPPAIAAAAPVLVPVVAAGMESLIEGAQGPKSHVTLRR
jgi:hypothetical protein